MRVFIFSIVIMTIIIAVIICNTLYIENVTNKMLAIIEELPENADIHGDSTKLDELVELWNSSIKFVAINTTSIYIIDITAAIIDVETYFKSDLDSHYKSACDHLYQAVLRLHELERFSIDNII